MKEIEIEIDKINLLIATPSNDQDVSKLLQAIYNSEEQRANLMKTYLFHYHLIRSDSIIEYSEYLSPLTDKLEQIDIVHFQFFFSFLFFSFSFFIFFFPFFLSSFFFIFIGRRYARVYSRTRSKKENNRCIETRVCFFYF